METINANKILGFAFLFIFAMCLGTGIANAGSITGTVFDGDTGLEIQDVQASATGLMDTCTFNIYVNDTLDSTYAPHPVGEYNYPLAGGSTLKKIRGIIVGLFCTIDVEHPIDGITPYMVAVGTNQTQTFSDGTNITIELVNASIEDATAIKLTDASGEFSIIYLSDDDFDLFFSKTGYQSFSYGPVRVINGDPVKQARVIPDGQLVMYPTGGIPGTVNGSIAGYVQNSSGDDIANALVEAYLGADLIGTDTTDATGFFNVTDLNLSGTYSLTVTATGYIPTSQSGITVDLNNPVQTHITLPSPIVLIAVGETAELWGYVFADSGSPLSGALVDIPSLGLQDTTDQNGFYNVTTIPVGITFDVDVTANGYYDGGINNLVLPSGGLEYNFTLWEDQTGPQPGYGNLEGYVLDQSDDSPIENAFVWIGDINDTTDATGYYLLQNVPEGNRTVSASKTGYYTDTEDVEIFNGVTINQNITLRERDDDDGGDSGSSSSSGSPPSSSAPPIAPPHSSSGEYQIGNCTIIFERDIERDENETKVTLELTNDCDESIGAFELREYPPEEALHTTLRYSIEPKQVYLQPLVIIWEINGMKADESMTIVYYIDEQIESNDFEEKIYALEQAVETPVLKLELLAPKYAFVGDNITLTVTSEEGIAVPNAKIIVTSPLGKEEELITDEDGKAVFVPELKGEYTYKIENAMLSTAISTQVTAPYSETQETEAAVTIETDGEETNFLSSLALMVGGLEDIWPMMLIIAVAVVAAIGIILYVLGHSAGMAEAGLGAGAGGAGYDKTGKQTTLFEEIENRQVKSKGTTLMEEIKSREVKPKRAKAKAELKKAKTGEGKIKKPVRKTARKAKTTKRKPIKRGKAGKRK